MRVRVCVRARVRVCGRAIRWKSFGQDVYMKLQGCLTNTAVLLETIQLFCNSVSYLIYEHVISRLSLAFRVHRRTDDLFNLIPALVFQSKQEVHQMLLRVDLACKTIDTYINL